MLVQYRGAGTSIMYRHIIVQAKKKNNKREQKRKAERALVTCVHTCAHIVRIRVHVCVGTVCVRAILQCTSSSSSRCAQLSSTYYSRCGMLVAVGSSATTAAGSFSFGFHPGAVLPPARPYDPGRVDHSALAVRSVVFPLSLVGGA